MRKRDKTLGVKEALVKKATPVKVGAASGELYEGGYVDSLGLMSVLCRSKDRSSPLGKDTEREHQEGHGIQSLADMLELRKKNRERH